MNFKADLNLHGIFSGEAIENNKVIQKFGPMSNKITIGARSLVSQLLGSFSKGYNPGSSNFGITKFAIFEIDNTIGTCNAQMLNGTFDVFDDFDPKYVTNININNFPCLKNSNIVVSEYTLDLLEEPSADESLIYSNSIDNRIDFTIKVGPGFTTGNSRFFSLAALIGKSPNPNDVAEYVYAIEQFPAMIKTPTVTFKFFWSCYF